MSCSECEVQINNIGANFCQNCGAETSKPITHKDKPAEESPSIAPWIIVLCSILFTIGVLVAVLVPLSRDNSDSLVRQITDSYEEAKANSDIVNPYLRQLQDEGIEPDLPPTQGLSLEKIELYHGGFVDTSNDLEKGVVVNCPDTFTDIRDGQVYRLVKIGNQCWMKDTLKVGELKGLNARSETNISEDSYLPTDDGIIEKYCFSDNVLDCEYTIGYYYTWDEAMNYSEKERAQGICPVGWHIPSEADWNYLEDEIEKQQRLTLGKNLNDYFNFNQGFQWEWTSTSSEGKVGDVKYHSVRVHRISGNPRGDRFGSTVRENKYYVRCLLSS